MLTNTTQSVSSTIFQMQFIQKFYSLLANLSIINSSIIKFAADYFYYRLCQHTLFIGASLRDQDFAINKILIPSSEIAFFNINVNGKCQSSPEIMWRTAPGCPEFNISQLHPQPDTSASQTPHTSPSHLIQIRSKPVYQSTDTHSGSFPT